MKSLWIAVLLTGSLMAAGQGYNQPTFSSFDTNKDGKITESEFNNAREKRMSKHAEQGRMLRNAKNASSFSDIDTNGDGVISKDELTAHQNAKKSK